MILIFFGQKQKGSNLLSKIPLWHLVKEQSKKSPLRDIREKEDTLFYFSDEYEPLLNEHDGVIKYLREGEDSHLLKQLRRGDFSPELFWIYMV